MKEIDELRRANTRLVNRLLRMRASIEVLVNSGTMKPGDFEGGVVRVSTGAFFVLWNALELDDREDNAHPALHARARAPQDEEGTD